MTAPRTVFAMDETTRPADDTTSSETADPDSPTPLEHPADTGDPEEWLPL